MLERCKIDKRILDVMFEDFDNLQEEYGNKIKNYGGE